MSRILVIDGHPNPHSLTAALAAAYAAAAPGSRLLILRDLDFDIHLRHGYTRHMDIEPDLAAARAAIHAADHIVVATPVWWRMVPALLKGFIDRALLPREEYRYNQVGMPVGLLKHKTGRVIITADTPVPLQPFMPGTTLNSLIGGTLKLCGIKPIKTTRFGPVNKSTPERRAAWLEKVATQARKDTARLPAASREGSGEGSGADPAAASAAG